jgi:electron transport complex protein RnfD
MIMPEVKEKSDLISSSPPHIKSGDSVKSIMWTVAAVLMFPAVFSVYIFGLQAALILGVCVISGIAAEFLCQILMRRKIKVFDGSSVITGLLLGMSVPPHIPLWIPALGTVLAVVVFKEFFGGLGANIFNPALAGRAFIMLLRPLDMSSNWHLFPNGSVIAERLVTAGNFTSEAFLAITGATPLTILKNGEKFALDYNFPIENIYDFFMTNNILQSLIIGNTGGCIGETPALLILAGGLFLMWRRIISWHVPVSFIGTMAFAAYIYYYNTGNPVPGFLTMIHIFSGGLLLGAFFMATDTVTTPLSSTGLIVFGIGCGLITFLIRIIGGYTEGVMFAILFMNAIVPLIDRLFKPRVFGV